MAASTIPALEKYEKGFKPARASRWRWRSIQIRNILLVVLVVLVGAHLFTPRLAPLDFSLTKFISPGSQCTPAPDLSVATRTTEAEPEHPEYSRIVAKMAMAYGNLSDIYSRAMATQERHNKAHGYDMFVLHEKILPRLFSKPAFVFKTIVSELETPEHLRLKWLFWVDLDIIVMNPNIPLETHLPPDDPALDDINILVTNDHNRLNDGAFFIRVTSWSAQLYADVVSMSSQRPEIYLKYSGQSSLEKLLQEVYHAVFVPQRWFNAYVGYRDSKGEIYKKSPANTLKKGDHLLHFAGKQVTKDKMPLFMDITERYDPTWHLPLKGTGLIEETAAFWAQTKEELASAQRPGHRLRRS